LDEGFATWRHVVGGAADASMRNPFLLAQGRLELARQDGAAALETLEKIRFPAPRPGTPLSPDEIAARMDQAQAHLLMNRASDAVDTARRALDSILSSPLQDRFQPLEASARLVLGRALRANGEPTLGREQLQHALRLRNATEDPFSPWLAEVQVALADVLLDLRQPSPARQLWGHANKIDASHPELGAQFTAPLRTLAGRLRH
jgi:tetratricopeptide (TPR) repeat protein